MIPVTTGDPSNNGDPKDKGGPETGDGSDTPPNFDPGGTGEIMEPRRRSPGRIGGRHSPRLATILYRPPRGRSHPGTNRQGDLPFLAEIGLVACTASRWISIRSLNPSQVKELLSLSPGQLKARYVASGREIIKLMGENGGAIIPLRRPVDPAAAE